jgi:ribosomal protein S27E
MAALALPPLLEQREPTPAPVAAKPHRDFYETRCGSCGEVFVFAQAPTDWLQVWCWRCGFTRVR